MGRAGGEELGMRMVALLKRCFHRLSLVIGMLNCGNEKEGKQREQLERLTDFMSTTRGVKIKGST